MALNEPRVWLIAYDIAHPRRLGRVHRYIKTLAMPAQYSLYVCTHTARGIQDIAATLSGMIHPQEDDVRIYQLPQRADITRIGRRTLPDGLLLAQSDPSQLRWTYADG
jgi:CRISPR-associated protein Cas2